MDIYELLYDITTDNMKQAGKEFPFSKNAYMYLKECEPNDVSVENLSRFEDNSDFLQIAYIAFLKRPVDEKAFENWKKSFNKPVEEFQRAVIRTLISSQEFKNVKVRVRDNIYSEHIETAATRMAAPQSPYTVPDKLIRIYRKQPQFIKNAIKKAMGVK